MLSINDERYLVILGNGGDFAVPNKGAELKINVEVGKLADAKLVKALRVLNVMIEILKKNSNKGCS